MSKSPVYYESGPIVKDPSSSLTTEEIGKSGNEVLTISEASQFLKLSDTSLYRHVKSGLIPHKKVGGQIRFLRHDLIRWLKGDSE